MSMERREFLGRAALTAAGWLAIGRTVRGQVAPRDPLFVETPLLRVAYDASGPERGFPIVLLHGFPDDARAWDKVAAPLASAGFRVLVPYLRGYGPTRFRDASTPRSGQQAAIGQDLIDFADALGLARFAVAGYDWGGRAGAIAAALHPDRVRGAVLVGGYTIQNTQAPVRPAAPEAEYRAWYQWYFNTERGRLGLDANRRDLCRLLWELWSPSWRFTEDEYAQTAASFDNPDFVDVVIHSYRHRNGNAKGDPRYDDMEARLALRPAIAVPVIALYGADDGVAPPAREVSGAERAVLPTLLARRVVQGCGHFMPRERPGVVSGALLEMLSAVR